MFRDAWEAETNFEYLINSRCTSISEKAIRYIDKNEVEQEIDCGSVVVAVGMKSKGDEALKLYGSGKKVQLIGDCSSVGNVQKLIRSAYGIASQL